MPGLCWSTSYVGGTVSCQLGPTSRVRSLRKKTDIQLSTLKCSYNRLLMTIDCPLLHGGASVSVPRPPSACLLANYFIASLINRQSDTLIAIII